MELYSGRASFRLCSGKLRLICFLGNRCWNLAASCGRCQNPRSRRSKRIRWAKYGGAKDAHRPEHPSVSFNVALFSIADIVDRRTVYSRCPERPDSVASHHRRAGKNDLQRKRGEGSSSGYPTPKAGLAGREVEKFVSPRAPVANLHDPSDVRGPTASVRRSEVAI